MTVEIKTDYSYKEMRVVIYTDKITEEVNSVFKKLSEYTPKMLTGVKDGEVEIIEKKNIIRIYTESEKITAVTDKGRYNMRVRLGELERQLEGENFIRISKSEIINLKMVKSLNTKLTGTICVTMLNGDVTYVSRRNVAKIKEILGI